jgi:hypothetical protein
MKKRDYDLKLPVHRNVDEAADRTCLKCDKTFRSRGKWNRKCLDCRDSDRNKHDPGEHVTSWLTKHDL